MGDVLADHGAELQGDFLPVGEVFGHAMLGQQMLDLVGDSAGVVAPEGLVGEGHGHQFAVGVFHHACDFGLLGFFGAVLLPFGFVEQVGREQDGFGR